MNCLVPLRSRGNSDRFLSVVRMDSLADAVENAGRYDEAESKLER
jgi:hypothetical protein